MLVSVSEVRAASDVRSASGCSELVLADGDWRSWPSSETERTRDLDELAVARKGESSCVGAKSEAEKQRSREERKKNRTLSLPFGSSQPVSIAPTGGKKGR